MRRAPHWRTAVVVPIVAVGVTVANACSEDDSACEAVESLQRAYDDVRAIDADADDVDADDVPDALADLDQAAQDAAEAGASRDDVEDLETDIEDVQRALRRSADGTSATATALAALQPHLDRVLDDTDDLLADISEEC